MKSQKYHRFFTFLIMVVKYLIKGLLFVCLFSVAYGFTIPSYEWYVTDKVWVFSETQKADLTSKIQEIEQATSIEIAILVVPTVDDDINLAAVDVGNQWWVGKKGQNNGLVLLIAVDDRKWSIQVGYGLEWVLPDLATKRIGEARFPSNFSAGNYYQGVIEMLDDALWYIKQDPALVQKYTQNNQKSFQDFFNEDNFLFFLFFIIFLISRFGLRVTVPSVNKNKKRTMKKYGRWIYAWSGLVLWLLITLLFANVILAFISSYIWLLVGILAALFGKTNGWSWNIWFGWGGSSFGWGSSWFGWFGGGGFGGWWSSGSR